VELPEDVPKRHARDERNRARQMRHQALGGQNVLFRFQLLALDLQRRQAADDSAGAKPLRNETRAGERVG
jgi:hypothetical protein